ncbi:C-type lectin domain family 4 member E-like [Chelonoidis abingdonii]|uniref:C-type lectin domain family 4 member E-like n=1 Tax=Chelonoidis abingdonii TaxID=106734 RepID=UPI0013F1BFEB|nr:C-type lectin domain family 2 member B-like isoform X1 [Chelonoidis abingdonii]
MQTSPSYCRYQNDSMELSQTKRAKMPHGRPDSMGSFEDDCERDYENVNPNQPPPQPQMQPQWQAKAEPAVSTPKAAEQRGCGRKSLGILYALVGVSLLVSTAAFLLMLLKWIPCCPHGWEEFQKKCYFFSLEKEPWEMARNSCSNHSAELAVISNPWEQAFLTVGINSVQHWISLSHKDAEGSWTWVDGSPVSYISSGIPSVNTQKRCIYLTGDDRANWSSTDCGNRYNFICERAGPFCV